MLNHANIAECLLAHAVLCRQIAEICWSRDISVELDGLADECVRTATVIITADSMAKRQPRIEHVRVQPSRANT